MKAAFSQIQSHFMIVRSVMTKKGLFILLMCLCLYCYLGNIYIAKQASYGVHSIGAYFTSNFLLKFNCVYSKSSYKLVSFEQNGSVISPGFFSRYGIKDTNSYQDTLIVVNPRASDTGIWGCTVEDRIVGNHITVYTEAIYTGWH